jgi:rhomboid protease GluP
MIVWIKHLPIATVFIIILNIVIFGVGLLSGSQTQIVRNYGFIPDQLFNNDVNDITINRLQHNPLSSSLQPQQSSLSDSLTRLFTSMFIHANIAHIVFNILALVYLGGFAERSIGIPRYITVYIISGIVAALFHGIIASYILHNGSLVLVGASGAISGVLGIAAAAGNSRAYYWFVLQIMFAVIGYIAEIPIAFTAHIGGFIAAVTLTKVFIILERKSRTKYNFID